jgi:hypothetical protein
MKRSIADKVGIVLVAAILAACATVIYAAEDSGFLRDYSNLVETRDAQGEPFRSWASPKLTPAKYHSLLIDPLVFYPEPRPSEQVSAETLQQILDYSSEVHKRSITDRFRVVDRAGPGVVRIRTAITGVLAQREGIKPYQLIPIALIATMASRAAKGGAPRRAFIEVETEATDSVTGELLALRVRIGTGQRLAVVGDQKVILLETVKPLLDELAADTYPEIAKYVKPK